MSVTNKYTEYAKTFGADNEVLRWVSVNLSNYLKNNIEDQTEIEHIIDYLLSDKRPKRLKKMSYDEARSNADKWVKSLIKKGLDIIENDDDTETVFDFGDGFKIVKLIGENAFKREGALMSHCVESYFGKDTEVYSLRDADNMPHCTIEKDKQIKGKGNGSIHPKYVNYIISFLESTGMTVGDNEMKNLGYVNVEEVKNEFDFGELVNGKYFYKENFKNIPDKDDIRLIKFFDLFSLNGHEIDFNFDMELATSNFMEKTTEQAQDHSTLEARNNSTLAAHNWSILVAKDSSTLAAQNSSTLVAQNWSVLAAQNNSTLAARDGSTLVARNWSILVARNNSTLAGRDWSTLAARNNSTLAGRDWSILAARNNSTLAGRDWSTLAAQDYSTLSCGKDCLIVARNKSKARGKMRTVITLCETNDDYEIVNFASFQIDGKKYKEDTFYCLKNGEIVEWGDE